MTVLIILTAILFRLVIRSYKSVEYLHDSKCLKNARIFNGKEESKAVIFLLGPFFETSLLYSATADLIVKIPFLNLIFREPPTGKFVPD